MELNTKQKQEILDNAPCGADSYQISKDADSPVIYFSTECGATQFYSVTSGFLISDESDAWNNANLRSLSSLQKEVTYD